MPVQARGLHIEPLFEKARMAMLPADHRLAGLAEIEIADLADDHLLQDPDAVPEWRDIATELRDRHPRSADPALRTVEEKLEHVATGRGIVILPASTAAFYRRPDVMQAAVTDIGPNRVCLAWRDGRRDPLISEFAALARAEYVRSPDARRVSQAPV